MDWFTPATKLLRKALALDLVEQPLYLLRVAELEARLLPRCEFGGFTGASLDLQAESLLRRKGAWRGRGVAIAIDDRCIPTHTRHQFFRSVLSLVLHEAAHAIEFMADDTNPLTQPLETLHPAMARAVVEFARDYVSPERPPPATLPPWSQHEVGFIRACCHIQFRAVHAGFLTPLYRMGCAGTPYGLSDPRRYRKALGDEPRERADEPISQILKTDPPEAFARLWQDDTQGKDPDGQRNSGNERRRGAAV